MNSKGILKIVLILIIAFFISKNFIYPYTGEAGPPLMKMVLGANTLAIGGGGIAYIKEPNYMDSNPAGGDEESILKISLLHQEWIYDVNLESICISRGFKNKYFLGLGTIYLYLPFTYYDYYGNPGNEYRIMQILGIANGGVSFSSLPLSIGINLKTFYNYIPEELYPDQNYLIFAFDIGTILKLNVFKFYIGKEPSLTVGFGVKNLGFKGFIDKLPVEFSAGFGYRPFKKLLIVSQLNIPMYEPCNGSIGIEYSLKKNFFIRGGINFKENPMFGFGVGLKHRDININLAYNPSLSFYNMLSISIDFNFGRTKIEVKKQKEKELLLKAIKEFKDGKLEEALKTVENLLELDPENEMAITLKKAIEKQIELNEMLEEFKEKLKETESSSGG